MAVPNYSVLPKEKIFTLPKTSNDHPTLPKLVNMKIVSVKLPKRETDIPQNIGESDRKAQAQVGHVLLSNEKNFNLI